MSSLLKAKGVCRICLSCVSILNHSHGSTTHQFGTETDYALDSGMFPLYR